MNSISFDEIGVQINLEAYKFIEKKQLDILDEKNFQLNKKLLEYNKTSESTNKVDSSVDAEFIFI